MFRIPAVIPLPGNPGYIHGDTRLYDFAPSIPAPIDSGWGAAPNGDTIGFGHGNFSRIDEAGYGCFGAVDFTFFQTFVDIPTGTTLTTFTISFSGMDDGSRVSIFNSLYPGGLVVPGSYVFLGGSGTTNLATYVVAGETNRVVITQVDDCPVGNTLRSATVVLNGTVVTPNQPPAVSADGASVSTDEGTDVANTGTYNDADGDNLVLSASVGTVVDNGGGTWSWSNEAPDGPAEYDVTISADDGVAPPVQTTFQVTVNNVAPAANAANDGPVITGSPATIIVNATDPAGADDPLAYSFDCDNDGTYEIGPQPGNSAQCTFLPVGDHTVSVQVSDGDGGTATATTIVQVLPLTVAIDIKPGSDPNSINMKNKGVIPVAILSDGSFDAASVDPSTVCFGDAEDVSGRDCTEAHSRGHVEDVDGDGDLDLVLHFETQETGIDFGDTQACLSGMTFGGQQVEGCDSVRVVK